MFITLFELHKDDMLSRFNEVIRVHKSCFRHIKRIKQRNELIQCAHQALEKKGEFLDFSVSTKNIQFQHVLGHMEYEYLEAMQSKVIHKLFQDVEDVMVGCRRLFDSFQSLQMIPKSVQSIEFPTFSGSDTMYFGDLPRVFTKIVDIFEGLQTCLHAFKHKIHTYHKQVDQDIFISHVRLELAGQWNKLAIEYNRQLNIVGYLVDFHTSMITTIQEEVGDSGQLIVERAQSKMLEISKKKQNEHMDSIPSCGEDTLSAFSTSSTEQTVENDDAQGKDEDSMREQDLPRVDSSLQQMRRMTLKYERTSRAASKRLFTIDGGVMTSDSDDSGSSDEAQEHTRDSPAIADITNPMVSGNGKNDTQEKDEQDENNDGITAVKANAKLIADESITNAMNNSV